MPRQVEILSSSQRSADLVCRPATFRDPRRPLLRLGIASARATGREGVGGAAGEPPIPRHANISHPNRAKREEEARFMPPELKIFSSTGKQEGFTTEA